MAHLRTCGKKTRADLTAPDEKATRRLKAELMRRGFLAHDKPVRRAYGPGGNNIEVVDHTRYLGLTVSIGMKNQHSTVKDLMSKKIKNILRLSSKIRTKLSLRVETIFVESIYRFFMTPMVLGGAIHTVDALAVWQQTHREFIRPPPGITNDFLMSAVKQRHWITWFNRSLEILSKRILINDIQQTKMSLAQAADVSEFSLPSLRTPQQMLKRDLKVDAIDNSNCITKWPPEVKVLCLRCTDEFKLPIINMHNEKETIFTDGGMRLSSKGSKHAGFGVYCESRGWRKSFRLRAHGDAHEQVSNNLAELMAIQKALDLIDLDE